jgi:superkiller protein 3
MMVNGLVLVAAILAQSPIADDSKRFDRLIAEGEFQRVSTELRRFTEENPKSPRALYQLGYAYYRLHQIPAAVRALSASLAQDSKNADAHRVLGYCLTIVQKQDLAEHEFEEAVRLNPRSSESHYALGKLFYEKGAYDRAATELKLAVDLDSSSFRAHQSLGLAYEALNDISRAKEHLDLAVRLNGSSPKPSEWPELNLASFYNRRGDYENARQSAQRALAIAAGSDVAHFQLSKAFRGLGNWKDCIRELQAAIAIDPDNAEFFYALSIAYQRMNDPLLASKARERFEQLKDWEATGAMKKTRAEPQ